MGAWQRSGTPLELTLQDFWRRVCVFLGKRLLRCRLRVDQHDSAVSVVKRIGGFNAGMIVRPKSSASGNFVTEYARLLNERIKAFSGFATDAMSGYHLRRQHHVAVADGELAEGAPGL